MSQHASLRSASKGKKHRSVMKRRERIEHLQEKGSWAADHSVYGLPKVKMVKIRAKKAKSAAAKTDEDDDKAAAAK